MTVKVTQPVHLEKKVLAATGGAVLATVVQFVLTNDGVLSHLTSAERGFVAVLAPPILALAGGYLAKHSLRADLTELANEAGLGSLTDPAAAVTVADPAA